MSGRLITVVEYTSLAPPFGLAECEAEPGFLLLFTDGVVMLEKDVDSSVSAKNLQSELEGGILGMQRATTPSAGSQESGGGGYYHFNEPGRAYIPPNGSQGRVYRPYRPDAVL